MAKKKPKRAAPTRACESCGTPYHPRSKACPNCGAANPTIGRRLFPKRGKGAAGPIDAAIDFVEQAGGFRAARAALETIERIKEL
jgi:Rubredoxin-like zinc ribbon domain (DUF35_N)